MHPGGIDLPGFEMFPASGHSQVQDSRVPALANAAASSVHHQQRFPLALADAPAASSMLHLPQAPHLALLDKENKQDSQESCPEKRQRLEASVTPPHLSEPAPSQSNGVGVAQKPHQNVDNEEKQERSDLLEQHLDAAVEACGNGPAAVAPSADAKQVPAMKKTEQKLGVMESLSKLSVAVNERDVNKAEKRGEGMKRPAASTAKVQETKTTAKEKAKVIKDKKDDTKKPQLFKKPAAQAPHAGKSNGKKKITRAEAIKKMPKGCKRCRSREGCTPSCWRKKGYEPLW